ncbi:putative signal peptide peptidase SppA [Hartmannibacter diazotrophicus]|uniref:Putative signal peptide peptidase SppA n=1 Tax=Hartmannibacter diazotrophicus TaxID=1482074 RepID=A0A2C9DBZ3_9HYPH|nr:signal peptide peptidase SppA [Hartmannibacter diazotrophicus]SON57241.1 putative signal peptide peptidase SppA [Hartmannibacter diazotrophicus]
MSLDADLIVERRRTRRKLVFWRVGALLLLAILAVGAVVVATGGDLGNKNRDQIARVTVSGLMVGDPDLISMLDRIAKDDAVKGVLVAVDSPGGATTAGEILYSALRKVSDEKPVAASVGTLAASAGYMAALAADRIFAHRTSLAGSIGVFIEFGNVAKLLDNLGVEVDAVKSAPLKGEPSMLTPEVPGVRAALASIVDDTYQWFVDVVAERRNLPRDEALKLADGRVFTGRQALDLKLVDEIGGEDEAVTWLKSREGVGKNLPVVDWTPEGGYDGFGFLTRAGTFVLGRLGIDMSAFWGAKPALDGLVSLWHPQVLD